MTKSDLSNFFEDAYYLQHGQFYPERHQANLKTLQESYPAFPEVIIDSLYRFTIHLDTTALQIANEVQAGQLSEAEALAALKITYFYFKSPTLKTALEYALNS